MFKTVLHSLSPNYIEALAKILSWVFGFDTKIEGSSRTDLLICLASPDQSCLTVLRRSCEGIECRFRSVEATVVEAF